MKNNEKKMYRIVSRKSANNEALTSSYTYEEVLELFRNAIQWSMLADVRTINKIKREIEAEFSLNSDAFVWNKTISKLMSMEDFYYFTIFDVETDEVETEFDAVYRELFVNFCNENRKVIDDTYSDCEEAVLYTASLFDGGKLIGLYHCLANDTAQIRKYFIERKICDRVDCAKSLMTFDDLESRGIEIIDCANN